MQGMACPEALGRGMSERLRGMDESKHAKCSSERWSGGTQREKVTGQGLWDEEEGHHRSGPLIAQEAKLRTKAAQVKQPCCE